jgi:hypothetical protein
VLIDVPTPHAEPDGAGGWRLAWPEPPGEGWSGVLALLGEALEDRSLPSRLEQAGAAEGRGWSVQEVEVPEETRAAWWAWHGWTEEDEGYEPLTFCQVRQGEHTALMTRRALLDLVGGALGAVDSARAQAAVREREAQLGAWVDSLPRRPLSWDDPPLEQLAALEGRAAEVDSARSPQDPAKGEAERQALLQELHALGWFDRAGGPQRAALLRERGFGRLAGWAAAADKLHAYLASEARRKWNPGASPVPLLASPVSIDWFRLGPYVGGIVTPEEWVAWGEAELGRMSSWPTSAGTMFWSSGGYAETFVYQLDNPFRAALLRVGRPVPGAVQTAAQTEGPLDPAAGLERAAAALIELASQRDDTDSLEAAITLLVARLTQTSQASGWYRLGLAALLLSQRTDDRQWRWLAFGALGRALVEEPGHVGAGQLLLADVQETSPLEGPPGKAWARAAPSPERWRALLDKLPAETRDELLRALAHPVAGHAPLVPALAFALEPSPRQTARGLQPVTAFTRRYVLKRLGSLPAADRERLRPALLELAASAEAETLQPHLRLAAEALGQRPRRWWEFWR